MSDPGKVIVALGFFASLTYSVRFIMLRVFPSQPGHDRPAPGLTMSDDRIARLEQTVESIAIEVERISEGQRFVTKLLSERAAAEVERVRPSIPAGSQQ
jgi:hypothetical protein